MRHRLLRVRGGKVAWTNTSGIPDEALVEALRFVAREVDMRGVIVHAKQCGKRRRTYGYAYDYIPRIANLDGLARRDWQYLIIVTDGRGGDWFHTLAHEAKHVEQYREELRRSEVACNAFAAWLKTRWEEAA